MRATEQRKEDTMNEIELGKRFAGGGELELEEVIHLYGEKLLRYATSILCDHHDAEDVVQRVFLLAYQNRGGFDGEHLSAWLYRITYNHCLNQRKKRRILFFSDVENVREETVNPFEDTAISDDFLKALNRLDIEGRALLYGRIMNEQSYEELSRVIGKSVPALRKQYERMKKKLIGYLRDEQGFLEKEDREEKVFLERGHKNEYKFGQV